jgi:hypothetical protein
MTNAIIQLPTTNKDSVVAPAQPAAALVPGEALEPPQPPIITVATTAPAPASPWQPPILGSLAVIFGVAALFTGTLVLAPLGIVLALAAGIFRQIPWAVIGAASAVVALATSKYFWALLGLAWLLDWLL